MQTEFYLWKLGGQEIVLITLVSYQKKSLVPCQSLDSLLSPQKILLVVLLGGGVGKKDQDQSTASHSISIAQEFSSQLKASQ